jgi:serine/threonine protein kinase
LNSLGEAKLADFGLGKDVYGSVAKSCVGTIAYLAPENLEKRMGYDTIITHKSDIWSLGLTLLECILGRFPHETDNLYDNNNRISLEEIPSLKQVTTKEFLEFCSLCLTKNQETRTSAKDLAVLLINKETDFILDSISSPFDLKGWLLEEQFVKVNKVE